MPTRRRKRPYTHSSWVCARCRKSHRKCTHEPDLLPPAADHESSYEPEDSPTDLVPFVQRSGIDPQTVSPPRSLHDIPIETAHSLQFFVDKISPFLVDPLRPGPDHDFWRRIVPHFAISTPFVRVAILGICELYESCPVPGDSTNEHGLILLNKTCESLQRRLKAGLNTNGEILATFLVSMLLAVATFHGLDTVDAFRIHLNGLHLITHSFNARLKASVARGYLTVPRPSLLISQQRRVALRHAMLLEPLSRCIPSVEFGPEEIRAGSMMHLLSLTNNTIQFYEQQTQFLCRTRQEYCTEDTESLFRELCDYQVSYARDHAKLITLGNEAFQNLVYQIRKVFEYAIVVVLKLSVSARTARKERDNVIGDLKPFIESIQAVRKLDPSIKTLWPDEILADLLRLRSHRHGSPSGLSERLWRDLSRSRAAQPFDDISTSSSIEFHQLGQPYSGFTQWQQ